MIKQLTTLLILLSSSLFAQTNFNPYHANITAVDKNIVTIPEASEIALGTTGVVMQSFDKNHKTIIAAVSVIKKEGGKIFLQLSKFDALSQEVLPTYSIRPKVGDEVILNFLYNRALAITPDATIYSIVTKSYNAFDWLHPDIFAASLATAYNPTPTKETFQATCKEQNIGLLLFAIKDRGYFVDCNSFQTINSIPLPIAATAKSPFYNRLEKIKGRLFGLFGGKGVKDYNAFYTNLLTNK